MSRPTTERPPDVPAPPLVATGDPALREEVQRLAAAAGVSPHVVEHPTEVLHAWARAPLVLVGADAAAGLAALAPARRDGVLVLGWEPAPSELFAVALRLGAEQLVGLPSSAPWLVETLTDLGENTRRHGRVVGVVGGSGGAGATTLACALGQVAARRGPAIVLDCDPWGPGVDRMLGLEACAGFRWDALCQTTGRISARALREAVPRRGPLGALSWQVGSTPVLQAFAVREALSAARRGHDTVVVDLPRSPDPLVDEVMARCDVVLVAAVPSVAGVASAARVCHRLAAHPGVRLVLRGHGVPERDVARATGVPVLASMADQRGLAEAVDLGLGPVRSLRGPLGRACTTVLAAVADLVPARRGEPGEAA